MISPLTSGMSAVPASGHPFRSKVNWPSPSKSTLVSETGYYIVRLKDASIATYKGGVRGLDATSPEATGTNRLFNQACLNCHPMIHGSNAVGSPYLGQ